MVRIRLHAEGYRNRVVIPLLRRAAGEAESVIGLPDSSHSRVCAVGPESFETRVTHGPPRALSHPLPDQGTYDRRSIRKSRMKFDRESIARDRKLPLDILADISWK